MKRLAPFVAVLMLVSPAQAAIDSVDKRACTLQQRAPVPDGSLNSAGDRAQVLGGYRGLFDQALVSTGGNGTTRGSVFFILKKRRDN